MESARKSCEQIHLIERPGPLCVAAQRMQVQYMTYFQIPALGVMQDERHGMAMHKLGFKSGMVPTLEIATHG